MHPSVPLQMSVISAWEIAVTTLAGANTWWWS